MLKSRFGRKRVQTHVERFREHRSGALTIEGEPDQPGAVPLPAVAPKSEGAIVESPAHAEPPGLDEGYQNGGCGCWAGRSGIGTLAYL